MRINTLVFALLLCSAGWAAPGDKDIIGSWEGESKCTVPDSPCHDEHVTYRIATDKNDPAKLTIDAYKIIDRNPEFMGAIVCDYHASQSTLACTGNSPKQDDWEFHVSGDSMTGTLKIGAEKTLYRRVTLRKARAKER